MEYELVYGLPKAEVLAQMAEELTEAAQAASGALWMGQTPRLFPLIRA